MIKPYQITGASTPQDIKKIDDLFTQLFNQTNQPTFYKRPDQQAHDFLHANFITDGANHDLDLSFVVPAGATAVVMMFWIQDDTVGSSINIWPKGYTGNYTISQSREAVINVTHAAQLTIPLSYDRKLSYVCDNTTYTNIYADIIGWFK